MENNLKSTNYGQAFILNGNGTIFNVRDIKKEFRENYIRMMRVNSRHEWNAWLKEEKELSYIGLLELELSNDEYKAMEFKDIEILIDNLFDVGGEYEYDDIKDIHKFNLEENLIYTVMSL